MQPATSLGRSGATQVAQADDSVWKRSDEAASRARRVGAGPRPDGHRTVGGGPALAGAPTPELPATATAGAL